MPRLVCPVCMNVATPSDAATCKVCGAELVEVSETLLATIPDRPGALAELLEKIARRGLNLKAIRAMPKESGMAVAFFSVDRAEEALAIPEVGRVEDLPTSSQEDQQ